VKYTPIYTPIKDHAMNKSLNRMVSALFFGPAFIFLVLLDARPYPFDYLIKALPVLSLCIFTFFAIPGIKGKLMTVEFFTLGST